MARDFSPIRFFMHVPNPLLARFFQNQHKCLSDFDFSALEENAASAELIFGAYKTVDDAKRMEIEGECREIEQMANHSGITALIKEANGFPHHDTGFSERMAQYEGVHGRAMWAFLEHPRYWLATTSILHAQNISDTYWRRRKDLPDLEPQVEQEDADRLGDVIGDYFIEKDGRGRYRKVDVFRRDDREFFFVYLSDYGQSQEEWQGGRYGPRAHLPSFEIIFVYCQDEGALDLYAPGNLDYLDDLQQIFAKTILNYYDLPPFERDPRVYKLGRLADREFEFKRPDEVETVAIRMLRLSLKGAGNRKIILQVGAKAPRGAIFDLLDRLNPPPYNVTLAELTVTFKTALPGCRSRNQKIKLTYPNGCNLRHEGRDDVLRKMLAASGIELTDLEEGSEEAT